MTFWQATPDVKCNYRDLLPRRAAIPDHILPHKHGGMKTNMNRLEIGQQIHYTYET